MAAYAVILRDDHILLSRLAKRLTSKELWTLPGGGLEHGEDPRDAVVREVHEETGLDVVIDETAHVYSYHQRNTWRQGRRADAHALRIVYDGWVPLDSPEPHVVEIDGSTMEAAWQPVAAVLDGSVPVVSLVTEVLAEHRPFQLQRVAAYALVLGTVDGTRGAAHPQLLARARTRAGGRCPAGASTTARSHATPLVREVHEETGLAARRARCCDVGSTHFEGTAPSGRREDFHTAADRLRGRRSRRGARRGGARAAPPTRPRGCRSPTLGDDDLPGPRRGPTAARGPRAVDWGHEARRSSPTPRRR